ncbi:MAG TPA: CHAT domain-containing protein [Woeseiaceae bacterium]|nr:CHAT domain-containing protein [Woeseiaceae bacterium]
MWTASRSRPLWVLLAGLPLAAAVAQPAPAPQPSHLEESDHAVTCAALTKAKRYADALVACERVLATAEREARTAEIPPARYQVATILDQLDRDDEALLQLQRVPAEAAAVGDLHRQLYALNRQGNIHSSRGSYERAIECFGEALAVPLDPAEVPTLVHARANRGIAWYTVGNYVNALADLEHAREAYESAGHRNGQASTYINLGLVNEALGELDSARGNFRRALELAEQDPIDERRIAEATHNLGYAAGAAGEYDVAAGYYTASLRFAGDERARARTLNNLGAAYGELGRYEEAARAVEESLAIAGRIGARALEGYALDSLGTIQAYRGETGPALASYQQALLIARETGDRRGQQLTLANLGRLLADTGQPSLATVFYKRSINISESIRADLGALPESRQQSYVQSVSGTYRELAALLIGQNRLLEAQRVIDLLKLQEADEFLRGVRGNGETATGIPQTATEHEILGDYDELSRKAIEAGIELAALEDRLRGIPREERSPADLERLAELRTLLDAMRTAFIAFLSSPEVRDVMAEAQRRIGAEAVELPQLDTIGNKLGELDRKAVVLYPLMLPDRIELLLATPRSEPIHRRVDVSQAELRAAVFEFRRALLDADGDALPLAQQLYDWLIRPIEPELERLGTELILYSPDDALRYVPLAALHDGESWLIERYRISYWTDSTIINLDHRMEGPLRVLGGAYTVPGHSFAIGDETFRFEGLEFAGREMDTIAAMLDGTLSLPGDAFVFDDLYRELFDFNVLHLATHAAVVVGQPSDSFILFGDGRRVTLQEIRSLNFDVDLVVLSACETALGGGLSDGVEVLGLGYAMQNSKARSIVASLWRVSDGGTHALMSEFYRQLAGGASRVDALRAAQLLLIRNDADAVSAANRGVQLAQPVSSRLDHPYYWAPFILIGTGL